MKQYTQSSPKFSLQETAARSSSAQSLAESQQKVSILENRIYTLQNTVDLQTRQIRRLEAALQSLEQLVSRK